MQGTVIDVRRVVLNGDDFGMSDGICRAIIELLDSGAISNTTVMTVLPDRGSRLKKWGVSNLCGLAGVHLQLSGGEPVLPAREIPSLVDPRTGEFAPREQIENADPGDVAREWKAQIELAASLLKGKPTHIDSHMGHHRSERFVDVYLDLAAEFDLPVRGGEGHVLERMKQRNVIGSTAFVRGWSGKDKGTDFLKAQVLELSLGLEDWDVLEITCHPGYCDDYLKTISSMNEARQGDLTTLKQIAAEDWLESSGLTRVRYPLLGAPGMLGT